MKRSERRNPLYQHWLRITRGKKKTNVCERWQDFVNFIQDLNNSTPNAVLSRPDLTQPWSPTNYRWVAPVAQRKGTERLSDADCDRIVRLNLEGYYSQRELAVLYDVQLIKLTRVLDRGGAPRPKERKVFHAEKIMTWCTETPRTLTQLAQKLNISTTTVRGVIATAPIYRFLYPGTTMPYFYTTDASHPNLEKKETD